MYYLQKKNTGLAYKNTFRFLTYLDEKRFNREDDIIIHIYYVIYEGYSGYTPYD